ncbi:MAG: ComA operon protein 2 [Pseudonocardiales bacterium]|nr:ComA operon protein 2 [Jatrophihabitantaceae bacterium]MCW2604585.1 ComA operon protein 2 [Pseudonocardiales bacterium]
MTKDAEFDRLIAIMASDPAQLTVKLGISLRNQDPARLVATMPVEGNRQPFGLLHGGATAALAETLGSVAALLNAPEGSRAVGVDLNITHHRSARGAVVTGVCVPLHVGRTVAAFEIVVTDDPDGVGDGPRLSTARLTCAVLARKPPVGGGS